MKKLYDAYLAALVAGDRRRALAVVADARASGVEVRELYLDVFQPALREVGRLWQENEMTVAEEHLATAITEIAMARLQGESAMMPPRDDRTILAACADSELHAVGLRMVCDLLEHKGWTTIYLGASVPPEGLGAMVRDRKPTVVALSASTSPYVPMLRSMIAAARATTAAPPYILVGGRPFLDDAALALNLGADSMARDAGEAVEMLSARFA
jgi:MerR family transcriptional regulator, light-induced transcriptional regulator